MIGNDRYQGNHITIIRSITSELDWNFRLQLAPDGKLGRETNEEADTGWNGMVGELLRSVGLTFTFSLQQLEELTKMSIKERFL